MSLAQGYPSRLGFQMKAIKTASIFGACAMLMAGCANYQSQQE
jgi:hypothetical protein